jgi:hypothetical protein
VAPVAYLIRDTSDLQRMSMRMPIRHETSDPGNAHQHAFIAQFAQRAIGGHARHAEGLHDVVLRGHTRRRAPLAGADVVQNVALDLQV